MTMNIAVRTGFAVSGLLTPRRAVRQAAAIFRTPRHRPDKEWERAVEARAIRATTSNGTSYLRWTPDKVNLRVIALHGWEGRAAQWGALAEEFRAHCVELIAIDAPAHGRTAGTQADPVVFAEAMRQAAEELGPFDVAIGHSMGGGSLALAISRGMKVDKAILIATPAAFSDIALAFATGIGLPRRLHDAFLTHVGQGAGMTMASADVTAIARDITIPALIIHDRMDEATTYDNAERISSAWDRSSILITQGLGHQRVMRDPLVIDEIIDFIVE
jgi:pimeloyl-ACP methyl ester carboxylesterase